jgi:hypothetical protein
MYRSILSLVMCGVMATSSGCSSFHTEPLVMGSVGGAAAGAGTGAIVGALIANGDVAMSALLGGAVGIPIGLAIGAIYDYHSEPTQRERNEVIIQKNQEDIFNRQRQLDDLREEIRNEGPHGNPNESDRHYHYNGPTYGSYYR